MAIKTPLVMANGKPQQLQLGDTLAGQGIVALTDAATITVDVSASSRFLLASIGGNRTFVFSNDANGSQFWIDVTQDATGSRTITWPSGIRWMGGATGTPLATAGKITQFAFVRISSGVYRGFQVNES